MSKKSKVDKISYGSILEMPNTIVTDQDPELDISKQFSDIKKIEELFDAKKPVKNNKKMYIIIGVIVFMILLYFINLLFVTFIWYKPYEENFVKTDCIVNSCSLFSEYDISYMNINYTNIQLNITKVELSNQLDRQVNSVIDHCRRVYYPSSIISCDYDKRNAIETLSINYDGKYGDYVTILIISLVLCIIITICIIFRVHNKY